MVYFFLAIIFLVIIFLLIFVNRKILQLRKGKNKKAASAEVLDDSTTSKFNSIFVNTSEEYISSLGNGYILNFLANRSVKRGFAIISDKRVYFRGSCFTGTGSHLVKSDEQRTVDIKDITGSGFIYRRYLGTLLALVMAFVTLLGGVAGSGYGISETVSDLVYANNDKNYAQKQLKDYKSFDEAKAKKEIENLKVEIEELKKIQKSTYSDISEKSEELKGTPEDIINTAIARQAYNVFCEDMGFTLYQAATSARDYLESRGVNEGDYADLIAHFDYEKMEKIAESYDESFWVDYIFIATKNKIGFVGDYILIFDLLNRYDYAMGNNRGWIYEMQKAMICEHVENNLQDYPKIKRYHSTYNNGMPFTSFLYYGIEDEWIYYTNNMPYPFADDYAKASTLIHDEYNILSAVNSSTREKYTQELLDTLDISYSGELWALTYQHLLKLYNEDSTSRDAAKEEAKTALAALNVDIEDIHDEIKKCEKRIEEIEETIEKYGNVDIKRIEKTFDDEQSEVNRYFVYTAGLGGFAALLLTSAISVMLVFFDYLKKRKTFFEIQYAGGRIAFNVSYYALVEIEDFQKMLRRAKDLVESVVMEPARSLVQPLDEQNNQTVDKADELRKYAKLLEDGLISQEEYDAMKKKVLGL